MMSIPMVQHPLLGLNILMNTFAFPSTFCDSYAPVERLPPSLALHVVTDITSDRMRTEMVQGNSDVNVPTGRIGIFNVNMSSTTDWTPFFCMVLR